MGVVKFIVIGVYQIYKNILNAMCAENFIRF